MAWLWLDSIKQDRHRREAWSHISKEADTGDYLQVKECLVVYLPLEDIDPFSLSLCLYTQVSLVSAGQSLNPSNAQRRIFIQFTVREWEGTRSVAGNEIAKGVCSVCVCVSV